MRLKNKILLFSLLLGMTSNSVLAQEVLSDVEFPKAPAYRVGISELPEKQYIQAKQENVKGLDKTSKIKDISEPNVTDLTYADLSIKRLSKEIAQDLEYEEQDMLADLSLLWQGAAVQSDTINFALYKLANPDADKPDEKSIKNVLKTIASMSTLVGASMGSPLIAGSSLIGGNIFGIMSQDTKALNYKYTRVNDADMIILIRKVEDLQQRAVDLYYDYMSAKKQLDFVNNLVEDRKLKFELAQKNNAARELVVITDAYYRASLDKQRTAKSEFYSKRAALEQFVGKDTFMQFEAELIARERGEKTNSVASDNQSSDNEQQQNIEYEKTIEDVKIYTSNLDEEKSQQKFLVDDMSKINETDVLEQPIDDSKIESYNFSDSYTGVKYFGDPMYEGMTGLAAEVEEEASKKSFWNKFRKKDKMPKEETQNVKKQKWDSKSTKNLIFLHGESKEVAKSRFNFNVNGMPVDTGTQVKHKIFGFKNYESDNVEQVEPKNQIKQSNENKFNLPPLDEIRPPDLTRGGYSIHSESMY